MSKLSAIEEALQKALSTAQGKKEKRPAYLKRLQEGAQELSSEDWDSLDTPAQDWVNEATKAANNDKDLPEFEQAGETEEGETATAPASSSDKKEDESVSTKIKKKVPAKKAAAKPAAKGDGYKGHRVGSNKEAVHKTFDEKGAEAAIKAAIKAGIKEGSAKSWISSWGGATKKAKAK